MQLKALSFAVIAGCALASTAWAHHSHGNYQMTEYTFLEGMVKEVHWVNPHAWLYIEVLNTDGQPMLWALETTGINGLTRIGVTDDTVRVGDTISVRCHQLRDGSRGCLLGFLTPEDGVEKEWD
jgi:hypothetical protein